MCSGSENGSLGYLYIQVCSIRERVIRVSLHTGVFCVRERVIRGISTYRCVLSENGSLGYLYIQVCSVSENGSLGVSLHTGMFYQRTGH